MPALLRFAAVLMTVFGLALAGWLIYRAIRARVGTAGHVLLLAIILVLGFSTVYVVVLLNPGPPLRVLWWILLVGGTVALAHSMIRAFPAPTPLWLAAVLGSPVRRRAMLSGTVVSRLGLAPGMMVVEVGAGSGHLSFDIAKRLLPGGRLICVDIQPEMIRTIREKIAGSGADNIETYVARAEQLPAGISDVDKVLFMAVMGEVNDKQSALAEAFRVLKPGGELSVSEFTGDRRHCTKDGVKRWAAQAGFEDGTIESDARGYTAGFRKPRDAQHDNHGPASVGRATQE